MSKFKLISKILFLTALLGVTPWASAMHFGGSEASKFSPAQVHEIEKIVHNYLVSNPKVLIEVGDKLRTQQASEEKGKIQKLAMHYKRELFGDHGRPVGGNVKGTITMVEFFDNQCHVCKALAPVVEKLAKKNPDLKIIYMDWPFFGKESNYAAELGLASVKQGKYEDLHRAFMAFKDRLTKEKSLKLVTSVGIDKAKLLKDLKANEAQYVKLLKTNFKLAVKLKLTGTPVFIFANHDMSKVSVFPGGGKLEELQKALDEVK